MTRETPAAYLVVWRMNEQEFSIVYQQRENAEDVLQQLRATARGFFKIEMVPLFPRSPNPTQGE